ncbi:MAG TPA: TolC family outer membrane protein, partial [Ideonella sp.]|nr:TolC family outer membrane protein [Ideonella sp.]
AGAGDANYQAALQALCLRVATAYFGVLGAEDALAYAQANEDAYRQQVQQSDQRYRTGLAALVDLDQARAYHAAARGNTIAARSALADAREALAEITGQPVATLQPLRSVLPMDPPSPADPQAWVEASLQHNPLLGAQRLGLDAAEHAIAAAQGQHLPTLTAGLDVGRQATWPGAAGTVQDGRTPTTATVGLTLRVPLFAGGATQSLVRQAVWQRDATRDGLESRRRQLARETLAQYRNVLAGIEQMRAASEAVEAAGKALAATRSGQELGTRSMTDLLLAIQTLTAAQGAHSQSRIQFVLSRLALKQAAGALGEDDLAAVNALLQ